MVDVIPSFNGYGCLPEGVFTPDLIHFKEKFVLNFPMSTYRELIFNGYVKLTKKQLEIGGVQFQWIDGSFTTNKIDPGDLDMVSFFDPSVFKMKNDRAYQDTLIERIKRKYHCHSFMVPIYPPNDPRREITDDGMKYWSNLWGHDRQSRVKGYIHFNLTDSDYINKVVTEADGIDRR